MSGNQLVIPAHDLLRFESLGDNCEFGFVLRQLGCEDGGLFRWAAVPANGLVKALRANLNELYVLDSLSPINEAMVIDARYGIAWHTDMRSEKNANILQFIKTEIERRAIHSDEEKKIDYLRTKFLSKLARPGTILVIKHNNGIPEGLLPEILEEIRRICPENGCTLLEVRACSRKAGTTERISAQLMRGYVRQLAPYSASDNVDLENWASLMRTVLSEAGSTAPSW